VLGGGATLSTLGSLLSGVAGLEPFLKGSNGSHPDLIYLEMLRAFPTEGLLKWHDVLGSRFGR